MDKPTRKGGMPKFIPYWKDENPKQQLLFPKQKKITDYPKERKIYSQVWSSYNEAKTKEKQVFLRLLIDLLLEVFPPEQRPKRAGRPELCFNELLFCCCIREYHTYSTRKVISELKLLEELKIISKVPHFNSLSNFLNRDDLYEKLQKLIVISSLPLAKIETQIAVDSSGFSVSPYNQWMKVKRDKKIKYKDWIKGHIAVGTRTQIICSAEVTAGYSADCPVFKTLFDQFSKHFELRHICADKAYSSKANLQLIADKGILPLIPFKNNANPYDYHYQPRIWSEMYFYIKHNEEEFMRDYHQRSNVESAFSMMKKRQGSRIRAKLFVAQRNELLCRFLVHNITVLIQEMFELGIDVDFYRANKQAAQQCKK